jgi:hypothetical protein
MTNHCHLIRYAIAGQSGRRWYVDSRRSIRRWCKQNNQPFGRVCDLFALFSPRVPVTRCTRLTQHYALTGDFAADTLPSVRRSVEIYEETGVINGPKTGPFSRALRGSRRAVVIDVWMCRALGIDHVHYGDRITLRRTCDRVILRVSRKIGWTPTETQAAIWTGYLVLRGRNPGRIEL